MRTIRHGATHGAQPAQRRLRAWRDCRAPVPSVFPSEASPDGKTEVIFKPGSEESVRTGWLGTPAVPGRTCSPRPQARSPRAFETIGIHLNIALGLSNEVGPPYYSWEHPYVVPYNGEEVHFHWANRDQYYVKAAEHFTDYRYRTRSGVSVRFSVRSASVEQNDIKGKARFYFPLVGEAVWDAKRRALEVSFEHRLPTAAEAKDLKRNSQQDAILERAEASVPEALATTPEAAKALLDAWHGHKGDDDASTLFTHHARRFARKRTSDFFIHRDLRTFLARELDYYLRSEVLGLRSLVAGGEARADAWLDKMRIIREVGTNVIEFLAQIEGFQKMLWEKRKFVVDVQYCVAARLIPGRLLSQVVECEAQWKAWRVLGCVADDDSLFGGDDGPDARREFLERNPGLLLDTRHFEPQFVDDLVTTLDDLGDKTDGLAIRSENWQALNLLGERYREALSCVYIDPPYNTAASAILYKNDYKDSSWLSLMADRLSLSRTLLAPTGILGCAIDDEEVSRLRMLMQDVMPRELGTVVVRSNPAGRKSRGQLSPSHEFALFFGNGRASPGSLRKTERELARYRFEDEVGRYDWNNLIRHGSNDRREDRPKLFFPIYVSEDDRLRVPRLRWLADERRYDVLEEVQEDEVQVLPVRTAEGVGVIEKNWHHGPDKIRDNPQQYRVRRKGNAISIDFMIRMDMKAIPKTWWGDARYASSNRGPRTSKDLFGSKPFDYPKAVGLVEDCLRVGGLDASSTVLDYFAGSGTTGHAVINLNREDGGRRKFILVEMGDHFDTVLMPRLKKVAFSPKWKNGSAVCGATPEEAKRGPRIIKYFRLESLRGRAEQHRVRAAGRGSVRRRGLHAALHAPVGNQGERDASERGGAGAPLRLQAAAQRKRRRRRRAGRPPRDLQLPAGPRRPHTPRLRQRRPPLPRLHGAHPRQARSRRHLEEHRGVDAGGPGAGPGLR